MGEPAPGEAGEAMPHYSAADDIDAGVMCYQCQYKAYTWHRMMEHLRAKHRVNYKDVQGTYIHTMALKEARGKQREAYKKRKAKQVDEPDDDAHDANESGGDPAVHADQEDVNAQPPVQAEIEGELFTAVWMKTSEAGVPVKPLQCKRMVLYDMEQLVSDSRVASASSATTPAPATTPALAPVGAANAAGPVGTVRHTTRENIAKLFAPTASAPAAVQAVPAAPDALSLPIQRGCHTSYIA